MSLRIEMITETSFCPVVVSVLLEWLFIHPHHRLISLHNIKRNGNDTSRTNI